jgi:hypothetical protein
MREVKRKLIQEKVEKPKQPELELRKVKKGLDLSSLSDAIIEGKLIVPIGTELITERYRNGRNVAIICTVKQIDDDGLIHTWDETVQQWYIFNIKESPKILKIYK